MDNQKMLVICATPIDPDTVLLGVQQEDGSYSFNDGSSLMQEDIEQEYKYLYFSYEALIRIFSFYTQYEYTVLQSFRNIPVSGQPSDKKQKEKKEINFRALDKEVESIIKRV